MTKSRLEIKTCVEPDGAHARSEVNRIENERSVERTSYQIPKLVGIYDYRDHHGNMLYRKCRYEPKSFSWRRPNVDDPGKWICKGALDGVQRVPYKLPELLSSSEDRPVIITEGEADSDVLTSLGLVATTLGSKEDCVKFFKEVRILEYFRGRTAWLIPDKDSRKENRG